MHAIAEFITRAMRKSKKSPSMIDKWGDDVGIDASCLGSLAIFPSVFMFW